MILGLDLSMTKTGLAILDGGKLIYHELLKPKAKLSNAEKLKFYYDAMIEIKASYLLDAVGIEQGFTRFNKATQVIFRVHGVANLAFYDIEQIYVGATQSKKHFTGSGSADKKAMIERAERLYGVRVSDDEADAIAIAHYLYNKRVDNNY